MGYRRSRRVRRRPRRTANRHGRSSTPQSSSARAHPLGTGAVQASEDDGDTDLRAKLHRYLDEAQDDDADVKVCALPMRAAIDQLVIVGANNPELVAEVVGPKARTILRDTNCSLLILRGRPSS